MGSRQGNYLATNSITNRPDTRWKLGGCTRRVLNQRMLVSRCSTITSHTRKALVAFVILHVVVLLITITGIFSIKRLTGIMVFRLTTIAIQAHALHTGH